MALATPYLATDIGLLELIDLRFGCCFLGVLALAVGLVLVLAGNVRNTAPVWGVSLLAAASWYTGHLLSLEGAFCSAAYEGGARIELDPWAAACVAIIFCYLWVAERCGVDLGFDCPGSEAVFAACLSVLALGSNAACATGMFGWTSFATIAAILGAYTALAVFEPDRDDEDGLPFDEEA